MKNSEQVPMSDLMAQFASDAVAVQRHLDAQYAQDFRSFHKLLEETPNPFRQLVLPLAPQRQCLGTFEVNARIGFSHEKTVSAEVRIGVHLLHFSADLRFQRDTSHDSQLWVCVEQVPCFQTGDRKTVDG